MSNRFRIPRSAERFAELAEELVLVPHRPTSLLLPEHFSQPVNTMRYPVRLDFSHERFRLRSIQLLAQLKDTALVEIDLSDNELSSLAELNRFAALKSLCASRNALESGPGVALAVHRLTRLDLSGNQLSAVPPLKELPLLQVLNVARNSIRDGWEELGRCPGLQALDGSHNAFDWDAETGELRRAMAVLRGLKRLRVLNLSSTPAASQRGYRGWVVANARKLELLDDTPVSEAERVGEDDKNSTLDDDASSVASSWFSGVSGRSHRLVPDSSVPDHNRAAAAVAAAEAAASGRAPPPAGATFGARLEDLLAREGGLLPRLVEEVTRHVQERVAERSSERAALTAEGHHSTVLQMRNAFEHSAAAGVAALSEAAAASGGSHGDVRAACTIFRAFLLELPQPLIPVELFLPLLEATQVHRGHKRHPKGPRWPRPCPTLTRRLLIAATHPRLRTGMECFRGRTSAARGARHAAGVAHVAVAWPEGLEPTAWPAFCPFERRLGRHDVACWPSLSPSP